MDEKEQLDVNEKLLDSSSSVEETTICDPIGEDTSDHATESEHVVLVEVTMKEENDGNKTLDNGRVPSAVEGVEESSITAGVHQQQLELSEDARPDQQEPTNCQQEDTLSGNLDNMKTLQLASSLRLLTGSWKEFGADNYLRGCKWAPDGSCLLSCSNDNIMRLYNLPAQLCSDPGSMVDLPEMSPALSILQGEAVYDFCWYPKMNSWEPNTCCFVTSCKDHPVQLWDAFTAERRTAYVPHNDVSTLPLPIRLPSVVVLHGQTLTWEENDLELYQRLVQIATNQITDEVASPYSVAFSLDGDRLYTGFNKFIKVFNTSRPGRDCTTIRTYERSNGGQPGIISCITMHPNMPGTFALGSYSCSIGLYCEGVKGALTLLTGLKNGVTHLLMSPDGNTLHAGYRKFDKIQSWDLRNPGKVLYEMKREVCTNQRIYFDLYGNGGYLISGSSDGRVYGWSLGDGDSLLDSSTSLESCLQHVAHKDVVNGASVHPSLPLLATGSGQRSFPLPSYGYGEDSNSDSDTLEDSQKENSLKLWLLLEK